MNAARPFDAKSLITGASSQSSIRSGARTTLPRWTRRPAGGIGEHEVRIAGELARRLKRLAGEMNMPLSAVLLAAHAKVIAALAGEQEITTGYAARGADPLPCSLTVDPGTWRALLQQTRRAELESLVHGDVPATVGRELGLTGPSFESVFDPDGSSVLRKGPVLHVGVRNGRGLALRFRYRMDALDELSALRIAGYHIAALEQMASDPDADHDRVNLLSPDELALQLFGLAGPCRELPDRRLHELIAECAAAHPDSTACVHRKERISYRELDSRANQLAQSLFASGLQAEDCVAVVMERGVALLAAVLGILKAGGAYLPIEPHFPSERILRMLRRADCRLVLTERGSTATLDLALELLPSAQPLFVDGPLVAGCSTTDPAQAVAPNQLAYVYFTSGSTGEPKGAMCEHLGMLNHVLAKIDAIGLHEGDVVAQTASQCFDISLWQLLAGLVVGGQTLIVDTETMLDPERFLDTLVDGHVSVLQVVPSYLEVLVSRLSRGDRSLPDLRCVLVTGEEVREPLVRRWFATMPDIPLINAYGLTETSDDTNHEFLSAPPENDRVPLGPPVQNVFVTVVDDHLDPVPLGAPGEITFSGICVGRGYVHDLERTHAAFIEDPHRPGLRLYRSGDRGRWRPDGKLEFLGRNDSQVKVSGFRIEVGDVETALLGVDGVRESAVVVVSERGGKRLVGFYTADAEIDPSVVRARLAASLPAYMVPSACHQLDALPRTANGKTDRRMLAALAPDVRAVPAPRVAPRTETERRIAELWAGLLGISRDRIGPRDDFFALGGTSLLAVSLAIALERAVSIRDIREHPVLADLAAMIDRVSRSAKASVR